MKSRISYLSILLLLVLVSSCSTTRHVPDGSLLLEKATISTDNDTIETLELYNFLRQQPNHKVLGFAKLQLYTYNLSGSDTTKWYNRWLRNLGRPPVIHDAALTDASARQLQQALVNRGFMNARVTVDSVVNRDKKKIQISYLITAGEPRIISSIDYAPTGVSGIDSVLASTVDSSYSGGPLDRNRLDDLRSRISTRLRNRGYYSFNKDMVRFVADTVRGSRLTALHLSIDTTRTSLAAAAPLSNYTVRRVVFITDYNPALPLDKQTNGHRTEYLNGYEFIYGADRYIKPRALEEKCEIVIGKPYSARDVDRTYESLSRLGILKFINIECRPAGASSRDGNRLLDVYILLSRNKKQNVSIELEGTNSEGDLGFGVGLTYQHRSIAKGSELLTAKFRTSYESLSGNVDGFINNRYSEYAGEVGITFPKFMAPFLSSDFKHRMSAATEFAVSLNYQERPEYTRVIAAASWRYKWNHRRHNVSTRRTFDLIDVNYVRLPESTLNFLDSVAPDNPLLRYSYEDHFIMRMRYTFYRTNRRVPTATTNAFTIQPYVTTLRLKAEMAGNLLYAISKAVGQKKNDGVYKVFGIQYSQYVKGEADYTYTRNFNSRNALAVHAGFGIAVPYGNSRMVPFEERFYGGGANNVRGWSARTLGPGCYDASNNVSDFINQCGDIALILSLEYRAKLFWVFEAGVFIDAGNIWTIRDYPSQPGGVFRFNKFYKQIAAAYGVGLRMDFNYFLLRFDLGLKAYNPAMNQEPWPLVNPNWHRDATFHFAVGYPF